MCTTHHCAEEQEVEGVLEVAVAQHRFEDGDDLGDG